MHNKNTPMRCICSSSLKPVMMMKKKKKRRNSMQFNEMEKSKVMSGRNGREFVVVCHSIQKGETKEVSFACTP